MDCHQTGTACDNGDVALTCSWTNALLRLLQKQPELTTEEAIKQCSQTHFDALRMEAVVQPFIGRPEAFYQFLRDTWQWRVTVDPDGNRVLADENKPVCVCPLVRTGAAASVNLCKCSEGFAERMFSAVLQKPVHAAVIASVLRGDGHCVYELTIE